MKMQNKKQDSSGNRTQFVFVIRCPIKYIRHHAQTGLYCRTDILVLMLESVPCDFTERKELMRSRREAPRSPTDPGGDECRGKRVVGWF